MTHTTIVFRFPRFKTLGSESTQARLRERAILKEAIAGGEARTMSVEQERSRVALVCEGDASQSETAFSGTAKRMFDSLVVEGHEVTPVNASLSPLPRALAAASTVSSDRQRWRSKFRYGNTANKARTWAAVRSLGNNSVDVLLQIGATYDPPKARSVPYTLYCDWNIALDLQEVVPTGRGRNGLDTAELKAIAREHGRRYREATVIFTISERLRSSFIELYGISPEKVRTVYAGPNFDLSLIDAKMREPKASSTPTILFIAKEFLRKGGDTVAASFAKVSERLPDARLVFAGSPDLPSDFRSFRNVENLGLLDKSNPQQLDRLLLAYRAADVLVLPSRHDPFPTVIREAMFFGLPCVASDIWAMPEMIEDNRTGFLVPPEDPEALASKLLLLLENANLRASMGRAARTKAESMFSWSSVGRAISDGLQKASPRGR